MGGGSEKEQPSTGREGTESLTNTVKRPSQHSRKLHSTAYRSPEAREEPMAKTIDELQSLLTGRGYACQRNSETMLRTQVATKTYRNPEGTNALQILMFFDEPNDCVAVEIVHMFDLQDTEYPDVILVCLLVAILFAPRVRPVFDPRIGEIGVRIDSPFGEDGVRDEDILQSLVLLSVFADGCYPEVNAATRKGTFDHNEVPRITIAGLAAKRADGDETKPVANATRSMSPDPTNASPTNTSGDSPSQAEGTSKMLGGHPNRLRTLLEFQAWLAQQGHGFGNQN